ncbi:hypothetical protein DES53_11117 [Roseimicrobium gellanilyticum]|uniref:Uncharacterized protein n=1 Tax=Roseimicrobium gellanilyticum TaxID=748857 RepID=A0A366H8E5_9BACT|nr:hypothetical protein [Roseimicrobium gellanilyticum]RBP38500.1 hypothetical protein DES53_11117 [Roseimicrobium gellanilyticum]
MTKVLFMLSAVVMVVAIVISYQNNQSLVNLRTERHKSDTKLKVERANADKLATEAETAKNKVATANMEITNEEERLNLAKNKLRNAEAEAERTQKDVEAANTKISEYKTEIDKIAKDLPPGFSIEKAPEVMNSIKKEIADNQTKASKTQELIDAKEGELKKVQSQLSDIVESIETRKKSFDRNSLSATIVAVNNDWGFVVIEGGENKGITVDTKLLVTRGNQPIGRLQIVSVDQSKTLANIDMKSVRNGVAISPGDRVILETLYQ